MPVYEYACAACKHEFEEWQKINDPPVKKCPKCGKLKVERLISRSSFQLKGGGWYSDLYSSTKPGAKADAGDSGSEAKSDAKAESKADTKSDAKVDKPAKADKPAKLVETDTVETEADEAEGDTGFGPDSHAALEDGSAPAGFDVKGNKDSMKYHVPGSRWYDATDAEVWFRSADAAKTAGFVPAGGESAQQISEEEK